MSRRQLTRYMPTVVGYRERLATLQGAWDSLALLSHLNGDGTNLGSTRQAFESLAVDLVNHLETETSKKAMLAAKARAQVVIDILVRSLFERTADIGLLAADEMLGRYAREVPRLRQQIAAQGAEAESAQRTLSIATRSLMQRLGEYAAKYSVYSNVILLSPEGEVLLQLDRGSAPARSSDPLINATLSTNKAYVESFRASDLVPESPQALIYSHRVVAGHHTVGVVCLCFRLADECAEIFAKLRSATDWTVLCLLDANGAAIASSDAYQIPIGARLPVATAESGDVVRFAGREYLAVTRTAQPYQGYAGPAWRGHVMIPLERAFEEHIDSTHLGCNAEVLADLRASAMTFSDALRAIPRQADAVQVDLNRSVWNGSVRLSSRRGGEATFAKALLREISQMGRKTQDVFERSMTELHETVVSAILHDSGFMASLAADSLARNLYERTNDCRWWALDATVMGCLARREGVSAAAATTVLRHIHSLCPIYHGIVLFDAEQRVVAVSRPEQEDRLGTRIEEPWCRDTLKLLGSQAYSVSQFEPSSFYGDEPTLVYGAAVRVQGRAVGGIALIFDVKAQLASILQAALPRDEHGKPLPGSVALFLDNQLRVMASTEPGANSGELARSAVEGHLGKQQNHVVRAAETYYAMGVGPDRGYREYPGLGGHAVVMIPLGRVRTHKLESRAPLPQRLGRVDHGSHDKLEYATFAVGREWYAVATASVVEAVDANSVQPLLSRVPWCAGFVMFRGSPVVVADMAQLLNTPALAPSRIVVIIQVPDRTERIGLLVEILGDTAEVAASQLLPMETRGDPSLQAVEFAIQPSDADDALVLTLAVDRLAALILGSVPQTALPLASEPLQQPGARISIASEKLR
jgi:chemotaxis signal transduction protein